ncbi:ribonuclease P protein subunit p40 isoform X2 [Oryzias latipes]|uniref:ribonuclease P protein subunit p40 isoform X2 n=1 Tax=Oryzias latipes TaxID=8090 RepID=UPI0005CC80D6|nr:ribonuclease P protein subunit p40 isoform X2 [Oryzias latipes]
MQDLSRCPRNLLVCERSSFQNEKNRVSAQVSLLLPDCSSAPSHLDETLKSFNSFYLIKKLPIYKLLNENFLRSAIYNGSVYGLSHQTRIDEDNCVSLMPNGILTLSLDKDSFELLGFEGKPSRFNHRRCSRFVVTVNLTDSCMAPGRRNYLRLLEGLKSRLPLQTDFLLSHHPGGGASLHPLLSCCDWSEHQPEVKFRSLTNVSFPVPESCDPHSFLQWLGAVESGVSGENSSNSFLSSLICPEPKTQTNCALSACVSGMLLPQDIQRLIGQLRSHLEQVQSWAVLTVHGFADSPVSWGGREHGFLRGGENFYSLLMSHDHTYHLHLAAGAHDACPP